MKLNITSGKQVRPTSYQIVAGFCILWWIIIGFFADASGQDHRFPFYPGEKLEFELKWSFISAGRATLQVLPMETFDGKPAWHFLLEARSNSFIDTFYKVRDRIDAYTDLDMNHSLYYRKKQLEGNTHRDIEVTFDHTRGEAQYTNFGDKHPVVAIQPGVFDPLSAFYFVRTMNMAAGTVLERPVTDGKKCVMGRLHVVKRETIDIGMGQFDTWLLEPDLKHVGGVFKKSRDAKIQVWVTADHRRIPIKIKSRVIVGNFVGELISVTQEPKHSRALQRFGNKTAAVISDQTN